MEAEDASIPLAISLWEAHLLIERGKIASASSPTETFRQWLAFSPIQVIPVTQEIAVLSRSLNFVHADPAYRYIAVTAFQLKAKLVTVDDLLPQLDWIDKLDGAGPNRF